MSATAVSLGLCVAVKRYMINNIINMQGTSVICGFIGSMKWTMNSNEIVTTVVGSQYRLGVTNSNIVGRDLRYTWKNL